MFAAIERYMIEDNMQNQTARHSGEGRNPDNYQTPHAVGQHPKHDFVRYAALYNKLDSGLRRNDGCCICLCDKLTIAVVGWAQPTQLTWRSNDKYRVGCARP